jgi:hypothetical protein
MMVMMSRMMVASSRWQCHLAALFLVMCALLDYTKLQVFASRACHGGRTRAGFNFTHKQNA